MTPPLRIAASCALAASLLAGPPARAADYGVDVDEWNGLSYLVTTAGEAKVDLEAVDHLDLSRLRPDDVLLWLHPRADLPVADLLAFVREGGFLVIADDRGRAGPLLEAVGLALDPAGPRAHATWYEGTDGLPILTARRQHFLFFNVETLTANYPARIDGADDVVLAFDDGGGFAAEVRLGEGAILAIADPSIFLNEMLRRFYGNKQFAANIMRLYCDKDICPVRLVLPDATVEGAYRSGIGRLGRLPAVVELAAQWLNSSLESLNRLLDRAPWIHLVAACLALLAGALLMRLLRERARGAQAPPLRIGVPARSPPHEEARGLVLGQHDADFNESARVLVYEVERLRQGASLEHLLDPVVPPHGGPTDPAVAEGRVVVRNALLRIEREADSVLGPEPTVVSAERFLRLVADARTVIRYAEQRPHASLRSIDRGRRGSPRA